MKKRTLELIEFIGTIPDMKLTYHSRKKNYEVTFKEGRRLQDGWSVINKIKFFYETMKLEKFDFNAYPFHVLEKSVRFFI